MTKCPNCKTTEHVRSSEGREVLDGLLGFLGMHPFRCEVCRTRFFRFSKPRQAAYVPPAVKKASASWPAGLPSRARLDREAYQRKSA